MNPILNQCWTHSLPRWPSIDPTMGECLVLTVLVSVTDLPGQGVISQGSVSSVSSPQSSPPFSGAGLSQDRVRV